MAERTTAEAQLERILYILAAAAREGGAWLAELATSLGVGEREVLRDLEEVTARAYYHPAGSVDSFQLLVEEDRVQVWGAGESRPARLSSTEALALGLGLRVLGAEAEPERRTEVLALARRLERALVAPSDASAGPGASPPGLASELRDIDGGEGTRPAGADRTDPGYELAVGEDEIRAQLAEAARERRRCRVAYLKPGDASPAERSIAPYLLAYAEGIWYLVAHDDDRAAVRVFRLDRILRAEPEAATFEVPPDFDAAALARGGRLYLAEEAAEARVQYSPRIARWLIEQWPDAAEQQPDGGVIVTHRVADPHWLVRHVLQYGPEAEVLDPPELRRAVAEVATRLAR